MYLDPLEDQYVNKALYQKGTRNIPFYQRCEQNLLCDLISLCIERNYFSGLQTILNNFETNYAIPKKTTSKYLLRCVSRKRLHMIKYMIENYKKGIQGKSDVFSYLFQNLEWETIVMFLENEKNSNKVSVVISFFSLFLQVVSEGMEVNNTEIRKFFGTLEKWKTIEKYNQKYIKFFFMNKRNFQLWITSIGDPTKSIEPELCNHLLEKYYTIDFPVPEIVTYSKPFIDFVSRNAKRFVDWENICVRKILLVSYVSSSSATEGELLSKKFLGQRFKNIDFSKGEGFPFKHVSNHDVLKELLKNESLLEQVDYQDYLSFLSTSRFDCADLIEDIIVKQDSVANDSGIITQLIMSNLTQEREESVIKIISMFENKVLKKDLSLSTYTLHFENGKYELCRRLLKMVDFERTSYQKISKLIRMKVERKRIDSIHSLIGYSSTILFYPEFWYSMIPYLIQHTNEKTLRASSFSITRNKVPFFTPFAPKKDLDPIFSIFRSFLSDEEGESLEYRNCKYFLECVLKSSFSKIMNDRYHYDEVSTLVNEFWAEHCKEAFWNRVMTTIRYAQSENRKIFHSNYDAILNLYFVVHKYRSLWDWSKTSKFFRNCMNKYHRVKGLNIYCQVFREMDERTRFSKICKESINLLEVKEQGCFFMTKIEIEDDEENRISSFGSTTSSSSSSTPNQKKIMYVSAKSDDKEDRRGQQIIVSCEKCFRRICGEKFVMVRRKGLRKRRWNDFDVLPQYVESFMEVIQEK